MSVSTNHNTVTRLDSRSWKSPHLFTPQISTYVGWEPTRGHIQKMGCVSPPPFKDAFLTEWEEHHGTIKVFWRSGDHWPVRTTLLIITTHRLILTWGVEQPPGDRRFRSAIGKTGESHIVAFVDNDVLWHFVDAGWNCGHKNHHTSVRAAVANRAVFTHKPRLGAAHWSFAGGIFSRSASEIWCWNAIKLENMLALISSVKDRLRKAFQNTPFDVCCTSRFLTVNFLKPGSKQAV